ncbi:hypothetical protein [Stackebrandtia soli]|uniref:hypothetical protein n=1 Tax=Stackebrandtia soli TaxID=1892856 RepID=UPI0039EC44BC
MPIHDPAHHPAATTDRHSPPAHPTSDRGATDHHVQVTTDRTTPERTLCLSPSRLPLLPNGSIEPLPITSSSGTADRTAPRAAAEHPAPGITDRTTADHPAPRNTDRTAAGRTSLTYSLSPSHVPMPPHASIAQLSAESSSDKSCPDGDSPRPLGLLKLGHRLIAATYVGAGEARLDLLGAGGAIASPVGAITGLDLTDPVFFPHPTQRYWLSEPATVWYLTRTTTDRYRSTPDTTIPTGPPEPDRQTGTVSAGSPTRWVSPPAGVSCGSVNRPTTSKGEPSTPRAFHTGPGTGMDTVPDTGTVRDSDTETGISPESAGGSTCPPTDPDPTPAVGSARAVRMGVRS